MPVDQARAERLVLARKAAGLERTDVVSALKLNYSTYGNYEDGHRGFKDTTGRRLAAFLKVNFDWLQTGKGVMKGREDVLAGLSAEGRRRALERIEELKLLFPE